MHFSFWISAITISVNSRQKLVVPAEKIVLVIKSFCSWVKSYLFNISITSKSSSAVINFSTMSSCSCNGNVSHKLPNRFLLLIFTAVAFPCKNSLEVDSRLNVIPLSNPSFFRISAKVTFSFEFNNSINLSCCSASNSLDLSPSIKVKLYTSCNILICCAHGIALNVLSFSGKY